MITCYSYFRYGNPCDEGCSWYVEDDRCPMEVKPEDWDTDRDYLHTQKLQGGPTNKE